MRDEGLLVSWDGAGNLFGRLPGSDRSDGEIWTGSHLDTVPNGGLFDGALGVVAGLEAVAALRKRGLRSTVALVVFRYEEGWRFGGGCFGSRAIFGILPPGELETTDSAGVSVREALEELGLTGPEQSSTLPRFFVEAHIEQGPVLESKNVPHAAVTAIAGIAGYSVTFAGQSGHAGTVPLPGRRDAFLAAAAFAVDLRRLALETTDAVATIGDVRISSGARNVVPGLTTLSVDVRAPTNAALERLVVDVPRLVDEAARRNGCSATVDRRWLTEPVPMSELVRAAIHGAAAEIDISMMDLHSGAGHDAGIFAAQGVPTGMLFVRSMNGGASHCPDELTDPRDIGTAISVLAGTLARLDRLGQGPESRIVSRSASA
jgi:hydantoinase/carbamoylase family amidase